MIEREPLTFPDYLRACRERTGRSVRELAKEATVSAVVWQGCEEGAKLPPKRDDVELMAFALGLAVGSLGWHRFMDLADIAHGRIPADLVDDSVTHALLAPTFGKLRRLTHEEAERVRFLKRVEKSRGIPPSQKKLVLRRQR